LTLDNTDGQFSPGGTDLNGNPAAYRNRPIRVGFGNPCMGRANTDTGTGPVASALTTLYKNEAIMAVAMTDGTTTFTEPSGYTDATQDDDATVSVMRAFTTDTTTSDVNVTPNATFTSSNSLPWATVHIAVPNGELVLDTGAAAGPGDDPPQMPIDGVVDPGDLVVLVYGWESDPNDRMGTPFMFGTVPAEFVMITDSGPSADRPRIKAFTFVAKPGMGTVAFLGADDGVTGTMVQVAVFTGQDRYVPRFCGEVSDWRRRGNAAGTDLVVDIVAGGALRRAMQNTDEVSPLRGALGLDGDITHYWPMEDPPGSTTFAPAIGDQPMHPINGMAPGEVDAVAGSLPTPDLTGRGARGVVYPRNTSPYGFGGVFGIPAAGTATGTNLLTGEMATGGTVSSFGVEYKNSTTLTVKSVIAGSAATSDVSVSTYFPFGLNGRQILVYIGMAQNGSDIDWAVSLVNITPGENPDAVSGTASGTISTQTLGPLASVTACQEAGSSSSIGTNSITAGHLFVTGGATLQGAINKIYSARGFDNARAAAVIQFTAPTWGVPATMTFPEDETLRLGKLAALDLGSQLRDIADAGLGLLSDAPGFVGVEYRPLRSLVSADPVLTLEFTDEVFTGDFGPITDDAVIVNDATVTGMGGGVARVVREDGEAGVEAAGRYARSYTLPVRGSDEARDAAGWVTSVGTFDEPRWPEVTLQMAAPALAEVDMQMVSIGDTIRLTGLPEWCGPDTADLLVVGVRDDITDATWTVTFTCRPAGPYAAVIIEADDDRWSTLGDADDPDAYPPIYLAP
jgi:hypothetical protein